MSGGDIVHSNGRDYQAVMLNVNGVTKRVLVPMSTLDSDNVIPTPDDLPPPVSTAPTPRLQLRVSTPARVVAPAPPATRNFNPIPIVPNIRPPQTTIQMPLSVVNHQITPPITINPSQFSFPPTQVRPVQLQTQPQIAVRQAGTHGGTIFQTGTLLQPNNNGPVNTVPYGTMAVPAPSVAQTTISPITNSNIRLPQQGVYRLDNSGRLSFVNSVSNILPSQQQMATVAPTPSVLGLNGNVLRTSAAGQVQIVPPALAGVSVRGPDGKLFTVPNHLLPTTVAASIPPVRVPQPAQLITGNNLSWPMPPSNVVSLTFPNTRTVQSVVTPNSPTFPVRAVPSVQPQTASLPTASAVRSTAPTLPSSNSDAPPFVTIAPKPVPSTGALMRHGTTSVNAARDYEMKYFSERSGQQTKKFTNYVFAKRQPVNDPVFLDDGDDDFDLPVKTKKTKDEPYIPPYRPKSSDSNRRRKLRTRTKDCAVVLKRLNVLNNTTVNLSEVPLWTLFT